MAQHLHLDPFSGIAGDMFLGAMLDLGVPLNVVEDALASLPVDEAYRLSVEPTMRCGIRGLDFKVHTHHHHHHGDAEHGHHHHKHAHYPDLMAMAKALPVSERGRQQAQAVVTKLAEAEAAVHGIAIEKVHFHEVGAVDSIVDMLGAIVALEHLNIDTLSCGPLPISRGFVSCDHGTMPVPAPATAELLRGLPTVGVDRDMELVTPTGAALVAALCESFGPPPAMVVQKVGYGAGDKNPPKVPNLLRVFMGERIQPGDLGVAAYEAADTASA